MHSESMPEGLVVWYDVKRQGATNEELKQTNMIEDLSGNGNHLVLGGFTYDGTSNGVIGDAFRFYRSGATATIKRIVLNDFTAIAKAESLTTDTNWSWIFKKANDTRLDVCSLSFYSENRFRAWSFGNASNIPAYYDTPNVVVFTPNSVNGIGINRGASIDSDTNVRVGGAFDGLIYSFLLFDRTLTEEEIEFVKQKYL